MKKVLLLSVLFYIKVIGQTNLVWAKQLRGINNSWASSIKTDPQKNVYVGGTFEGTIDLDPGPSVD